MQLLKHGLGIFFFLFSSSSFAEPKPNCDLSKLLCKASPSCEWVESCTSRECSGHCKTDPSYRLNQIRKDVEARRKKAGEIGSEKEKEFENRKKDPELSTLEPKGSIKVGNEISPSNPSLSKIEPVKVPKPADSSSVKEGNALARRVRAEFQKTHDCPKTIEEVKNLIPLAQKLMKEKRHVRPDLSALIYHGKYSLSCGYNLDYKKWFRTKLHCVSQTTCFGQDQEDSPVKAERFDYNEKESVYILTKNLAGYKSYRKGGNIGDYALILMAERVFLQVALYHNEIIYAGLVIAP